MSLQSYRLLLSDASCLFLTGWSFQMGSAYQFHSWRVFVLVCAFPSVAAICALTTMPESPRFFLEVRQKGQFPRMFSRQVSVFSHPVAGKRSARQLMLVQAKVTAF